MALYNQYRPMNLEQVKGQSVIKNQLKAMFTSGQVPNALLFTGPRGTGKTTIARIVARYVNCENPQGDPCNECSTCKAILAGKSADVMELDAASNNKVEDVRQLIENAQYAPQGKYKVYILDEVHMLSMGAWNALLKILEEPPKNVVFILCTTEEHKIPATIVSRCRKFFFERVDLSEIVSLMEDICGEKDKAYDKDALLLIARASEGCVRDALSILESFLDVDSVVTENVANTLGLSGEDIVFNILDGVQRGDAVSAVNSLKQAEQRGVSLASLVKALIGAISDALFINQGADIGTVVNTALYKERLAAFAPALSTDRALELIGELTSIYGTMSKMPDASFLLETGLLKAVQYQSELERLKGRVDELETAIKSGEIAITQCPAKHVPIREEVNEKEAVLTKPEPETKNTDALFEYVNDEPPFDEDPEPDVYGVPDSTPAAEEISVKKGEEDKKPATPAPSEPFDEDADLFSRLHEQMEVGEAVDLFASTDDAADDSAEERVDEPEEPYIKSGAEMPSFNTGLAGFLWQ